MINKIKDGYIKFDYSWQQANVLSDFKIKKLNKYRNKLFKQNLIGAFPNGVGFGNISLRYKNNQFIITGSKTGNYQKLSAKDYALVTDWDIKHNYLSSLGLKPASSESLTHAAIYQADDNVKAIIHIHNLELWQKLINQVPTTKPTATYGTVALAQDIGRLFKQTDVKNKKILVTAGHQEGLMVFGKSLKQAYKTLNKYLKS